MNRNNRKAYEQQLKICYETIDYLQEMISNMEQQLEDSFSSLRKCIEKRNDHRFIRELFRLCREHSSNAPDSTQSYDDRKTYIQQTFNHLLKRSSTGFEPNHRKYVDFTCKCSQWMKPNHYPDYQTCLDIIEEYQMLFDVKCYKQIPISLTDFYHKHGELNNFMRSISDTVGVENQNEKLVIKTLGKMVEVSKIEQMKQFKKLTRVKNMNEAMDKIRSYDDFVPYYHQFIEQLINLLDISKPDQILPAIKMLKLLAKNKRQHE